MAHNKRLIVDSPLGKQEIDHSGSPVGVVRMDVDQAYAGTGELLQKVINDADQDAWNQIRAKIDYMFENTGARAVGISFRSPHSKRFHYSSNAPLALIIKPVKAETVSAAKSVVLRAVPG